MALTSNGNYGHRRDAHSSEDGRSSASSTLNRRNCRLPAYAFILPNLEQFPDDFRRFLEKEMIEIHTLKRLETSGHLNWWCTQNASQRLWPLVTTGDGNCLLHAASLGIWGVHDRQLNLRQLLHEVLTTGERRNAFYRRWRWHESKTNLQSELVLTEEEWKKEWQGVLELAAPTPRANVDSDGSGSNEQIYESLECIHVFALAQVLRRPIIVVADTVLRNANGEELAPIPFGGIYLPLEFKPEHCHRSPLVLCYDASHFSALVAMRQISSNYLQAIPITDRNRNLLHVHYAVDPGADFTWWKDGKDHQVAESIEMDQTDDRRLELIGTYMDIVKMDLRRGSIKKTMPVTNATEFTPSVPLKLLTLASSGKTDRNNRSPNRIITEIRQHFRWLTRKSKRKANRPTFSASELRQSNCVLTVLLHNYAHQYMDSMVSNYISGVKERFERYKQVPSCNSVPKNRLSRSFSSSSVLLTCLNPQCNKSASPSNNFLCGDCFEDQKREMASIGSFTSPTNSSTGNSSFENHAHNDSAYCSKSSTMPAISDSAKRINSPTFTDPMEAPLSYNSSHANSSYRTARDSVGSYQDYNVSRGEQYTPSTARYYPGRAYENCHVNVYDRNYRDYDKDYNRGYETKEKPFNRSNGYYVSPEHYNRPSPSYPEDYSTVLSNELAQTKIIDNRRPRPVYLNHSLPTYELDQNYYNTDYSSRSVPRARTTSRPVFSSVQRYISNSVSPTTPLAANYNNPLKKPTARGHCGTKDVISQKNSTGAHYYYAAS